MKEEVTSEFTSPAQLLLIGIGPGDLEQMTIAAQAALRSAEVVIGYEVYIELVRPVLRPEQEIILSPIGSEMERAQQAVDLATAGRRVALISSGDIGIYAMASPVFEILSRRDWSGQGPEVEVFSGISAVQAAAARLGAPLGHDFCTISLSDLLTPWPVIERRLQAAAWGDFVVAFYNPRSRKRDWQLPRALEILLAHRPAATPVAVVHHVTRPEEQIILTTLGELEPAQVDMFTLVLVGNSQSYVLAGHLVTPRGYEVGSRGDEEQGSGGAEEQGSGGAEEQGSGGGEEQRSRGAGEQRRRGAEEQRSGGAGEQGSGGGEEAMGAEEQRNEWNEKPLSAASLSPCHLVTLSPHHPDADIYPITLIGMLGERAVVVGGGVVGQRKVQGLLAAGVEVKLISPEATAQLQAWAEEKRICWERRPYQPGDAQDARLVFAATNQRAVNAQVAEEARTLSLLCNVADQPAEGSFHVPAVHRRPGLVVAVSSLGESPRRAQKVRDQIEIWLGDEAMRR